MNAESNQNRAMNRTIQSVLLLGLLGLRTTCGSQLFIILGCDDCENGNPCHDCQGGKSVPAIECQLCTGSGVSGGFQCNACGGQGKVEKPNPTSTAANVALPRGWISKKDSSGKPYYVHTATNYWQWKHPILNSVRERSTEYLRRGAEAQRQAEARRQAEAQRKRQQNARSYHAASRLPVGWRSGVDPKTTRPYYANMVTNQSQWVRPYAPAAPLCPGKCGNLARRGGRYCCHWCTKPKYQGKHHTTQHNWKIQPRDHWKLCTSQLIQNAK